MTKRMNWVRARKPATAASFPGNERLNRAADRWLGETVPPKAEKRGWNDSRGAAGPCVSLITGRTIDPGPAALRHQQQPYADPSPPDIKPGTSPTGGLTKATLWATPKRRYENANNGRPKRVIQEFDWLTFKR
jgi:hypothetical protein